MYTMHLKGERNTLGKLKTVVSSVISLVHDEEAIAILALSTTKSSSFWRNKADLRLTMGKSAVIRNCIV